MNGCSVQYSSPSSSFCGMSLTQHIPELMNGCLDPTCNSYVEYLSFAEFHKVPIIKVEFHKVPIIKVESAYLIIEVWFGFNISRIVRFRPWNRVYLIF